jgi:uncharacterized membrane protein YidH (DUF202 family)
MMKTRNFLIVIAIVVVLDQLVNWSAGGEEIQDEGRRRLKTRSFLIVVVVVVVLVLGLLVVRKSRTSTSTSTRTIED